MVSKYLEQDSPFLTEVLCCVDLAFGVGGMNADDMKINMELNEGKTIPRLKFRKRS